MHPQGDLEVVILGSRRAQVALHCLFLLSLLLDLDILLMPALIRHGVVHPSTWSNGLQVATASVEVVAMVGASLLWLVMLYFCFHDPGRPFRVRVLWVLFLVVGIWFASQVFYLFPFRQMLIRHKLS
jgi:phosphate/sulfate permease